MRCDPDHSLGFELVRPCSTPAVPQISARAQEAIQHADATRPRQHLQRAKAIN